MVTFSMTFTDPSPGFQGHGIFEVEYLKTVRVMGTKLLSNSNGKPYPVYRMVQLPMTLIDS